jgi:hypothetical protein
VQPRREAEAVAPAPVDHSGHAVRLLRALHAERHQQDPVGWNPVRGLDREHLLHVRLVRHHELEPRGEREESRDRLRAQADAVGHLRMRELQRDVPLIDGRRGRDDRARGFHLHPAAEPVERLDQRNEGGVLERLAAGHDDVRRRGRGDGVEDGVERRRLPAVGIPRVLRVAPRAADRAALQPDEHRRRADARAFALDGGEDLADAEVHQGEGTPGGSGISATLSTIDTSV